MPCPPTIGGSPIPLNGPTQRYVPPKLASAREAKPAPVVRGQAPEPIRIPTPDELGLSGKPLVSGDESLDWNAIDRELDAAGVTGFQIERAANGFRFTCQLASGSVVGRGATKGEAVRNALRQLGR